MEAIAHKSPSQPLLSKEEQLRAAREIMRLEAVALWKLSGRLDETFHRVVEQIYQSRGSLIVTGMGKAGLIGQKIAATMASVGHASMHRVQDPQSARVKGWSGAKGRSSRSSARKNQDPFFQ